MSTKLPLVLSATALAVAVLGTTPLAAIAQNVAFPRSSVGSAQLKRGAVTAPKIAPDAVRASHVQNGSLLAADFKPGQLPQGPKGEKGDTGDKGDKGDQGAKGDRGVSGGTNAVIRVVSWSGGSGRSVNCAAGEVATGGGFYGGGTPHISRPTPGTTTSGTVPTGWEAFFVPTSGSGLVYAVCVSP